jgi:hypothetical protein
MSDRDIINELSQQRISPREINDALKQAQIKNAVSNPSVEDEMQASQMPEEETYQPMPMAPSAQQMQTQQEQQYSQQEYYAPQQYPQEAYAQQGQQYYQPAEQQQQQYTQGVDTDMIMEIADQIFSEKIKKIQKQSDANFENVSLLQSKAENISERLKKIETTIDKLQIAILERVGSYGQNLESIKKEMSMMGDSFSKMISPQRKKEEK